MTPTTLAAATEPEWGATLHALLDEGGEIRPRFQPIIDVARGVVAGYEALARFERPEIRDIEGLFTAASVHGVADRLEAAALRAAFAHRSKLPPNCFLTVNVSPAVLASEAINAAFDEQGDLNGVVVELTEQAAIESYAALDARLARLRAAGALIAVDDAGSGYAGLRHLLDLRPSFIKVDRYFVGGIDHDPAKRVLIEMLGTFADRTDSWLIAEGVERVEELDVLAELGVPLAQGYLTGRPIEPWGVVPPTIQERLARRRAGAGRDSIRRLIETRPSATSRTEATGLLAQSAHVDGVMLLDQYERPTAYATARGLAVGVTSEVLRVNVDTPIAAAAQRAMQRSQADRFQPLAATDQEGRYLGVVEIERLVEELSKHAPPELPA